MVMATSAKCGANCLAGIKLSPSRTRGLFTEGIYGATLLRNCGRNIDLRLRKGNEAHKSTDRFNLTARASCGIPESPDGPAVLSSRPGRVSQHIRQRCAIRARQVTGGTRDR